MANREVVTHLDRKFVRRPKFNSWRFVVDHKPKEQWMAEYEKTITLDGIGKDLSQRNAKAGRELTYEIEEGVLYWTLRYPNVKRKTTGYIKPSYGVPFKKRRRT